MSTKWCKVKKAIKDGNLLEKTTSFIQRKAPKFTIITNPEISETQFRDTLMRKMRKKYDKEDYFKNNYIKGKKSNKIFVLWLQGEINAPKLVQTCIHSMRNEFPESEVVVLDAQNLHVFTDIPEYIWKKYESGKITNTHFSDIIRTNILLNGGGTWLDSTVFISPLGSKEYLFQPSLFVFKDLHDPTTVLSSWCIHADSGNDILSATQNMLFQYWRENDKLNYYYLFHYFFTIAARHYEKQWADVPTFSNEPSHILQRELDRKYNPKRFDQIIHMANIHKLSYKLDVKENINGTLTNYGYLLRTYGQK